jgi:hypothetical protein
MIKTKLDRDGNKNYPNDRDDDYDSETDKKARKIAEEGRRPIRNWKKVWSEHMTDYDEVDDFFIPQNRR